MREAVLDRLHVEFGEPASETATVLCWHLAPGFDMIAEKDSAAHWGVVWIPWRTNDPFLEFAEFYDRGTERHPGTYDASCLSLAAGRSALRISIQRQVELDQALVQIKALAKR